MMFVLAADYVDLYIAKHCVWPQTIVLVSVCVFLSVPCSQFFFFMLSSGAVERQSANLGAGPSAATSWICNLCKWPPGLQYPLQEQGGD